MPLRHLKTMSHMKTSGIRVVNKIGMRSTEKRFICFDLCSPAVGVKMMISGNRPEIFSDNITVLVSY